MLLIRHFIAPSPIHGLGCFSSVNVKKGEKIWEFHPIIDRVIPLAELATLPPHTIDLIKTHAEYYPETSEFKLGADGDFFMNHSDDPNLENFGDFAIASRDFHAGEEITCDYRSTKVWAFPLDFDAGQLPTTASMETQK